MFTDSGEQPKQAKALMGLQLKTIREKLQKARGW